MQGSIDSPKIFISYSWNPPQNKRRVLDLAERLSSDGVFVNIDTWSLSEGQDKNKFMEQMVNDPQLKRVLLICNKEYTHKANERSGGVGIESLIISDEIYKQADQTKFIPIIFERNENGKEYIPTFITSRLYIDFSDQTTFEENYEKLLRNLFDKPANRRPPIGLPPAYISNDTPVFIRTMHKTKGVLDALVNSRPIANALIKDYYDIFILALEDFKITDEEYKAAVQNEFDEIIVKKIEMLRPLRDDFIIFFEGIIRYSSSIDIESLQNFLSRFISFISTIRLSPSQRRFFSDQFEFFAYELFLYIVAIMIDNEKFSELSELLMSPLLEQNEANGMIAAPNFVVFRYYVESLNDFRNKRLGLRRSSMTADLIKERADNTKYPFHKLAEMDLLLYLISLFIPPEIKKLLNHPWFPELGVYGRLPIKIFQRSISKKYFNKVKCILNVQDKSEIVTALKSPEVESFIRRVQSQLYYFDSVDSLLNLQKIATIP